MEKCISFPPRAKLPVYAACDKYFLELETKLLEVLRTQEVEMIYLQRQLDKYETFNQGLRAQIGKYLLLSL